LATQAVEGAKPRRRITRESPAESDNPIEIAMASASTGRPLPDVARTVLEKHAKLIDYQVKELRLRHVGESVRAALWAILAIAAAAILALVIAIVIRASRSDALVVQSFRVPPSLAARGLTGEVVATQILDNLAEFESQSQSSRAASTYANNWEDELKIDIPNTGASADQLWKLLRGWLGKETRISGEIIETKDGLALTTRVGATSAERFASNSGDLDALVLQGAELIYRNTQPYRYAVFVGNDPKRAPERVAILKRLTVDPSPVERKWAYAGLAGSANARGDWAGAIAMADRALAIDPEMRTAMINKADAHRYLGHDQATVDLSLRELSLPVDDDYDAKYVTADRCFTQVNIGIVTRDPGRIDDGAACAETAAGVWSELAPAVRVYANLVRNDPMAVLALRLPPSAALPAVDADILNSELRLYAEMLRGPSAALAQALDAYVVATRRRTDPASSSFSQQERAETPVEEWPIQAEALAILGRHTEAAALIAKTPLDCYTCVRTRGLVARAAGDPGAAQSWYAEAARQGPRLAPAFADWGRLLAEHRRFAGAEVKLREAIRLAPNWADPLKYWGDALAAQDRRAEALTKYDAALKLAPNWSELRQNRARVASR
jgi:tetratricopeptide (TPR) repeat protein